MDDGLDRLLGAIQDRSFIGSSDAPYAGTGSGSDDFRFYDPSTFNSNKKSTSNNNFRFYDPSTFNNMAGLPSLVGSNTTLDSDPAAGRGTTGL